MIKVKKKRFNLIKQKIMIKVKTMKKYHQIMINLIKKKIKVNKQKIKSKNNQI